jgi:hypothetical protein
MDKFISLVFVIFRNLWRFFVDHILPIIIEGVKFSLLAMLYSMAAIWVGWGPATNRISDEWMSRAAKAGWPSSLDPYLHPVTQVGAFFMVSWGWFLFALMTASIFNTVLRFITGWHINF